MNEWNAVLVSPDTLILNAIEIIDRGAVGAAIVVDDNRRLVGVVTDGDIRRGLLRKVSTSESVSSIMNPNPKIAEFGESKNGILNIMQNFSLQQIPIVDEEKHVVGLEVLNDLVKPEEHDNHVIIMAGGLGTRLRPLTDNCPKPLLKIDSKPVLQIILESFIEYGFKKFIFTLNYRGQMIRDYFKDGKNWNVEINYIEESKPLGTAGSLGLLDFTPSNPFIVINGDIMTRINYQHLIDYHIEQQSIATVCVREYKQTIPYGVVRVDKNVLLALEEKPVEHYFVNAGIYVLDRKVLSSIKKDQHLDMTDLISQLVNRNIKTSVFPIREYWTDIGQMADFEKAHEDYHKHFSFSNAEMTN